MIAIIKALLAKTSTFVFGALGLTAVFGQLGKVFTFLFVLIVIFLIVYIYKAFKK